MPLSYSTPVHIKLCLLCILIWTGCQTNETNEAVAEEMTTVPPKDTIVEIPEPEPFVIDYDSTKWTDLEYLIPDIVLDLRYATTDNFVGTKMYECGRCFARPEVAEALVKIQERLKSYGLGLKMYDCYRPRPIQQLLWDKVPDARYVTPPKKGSMHNRGTAVDLTIVDENGEELDMGTPFDYFGKEAYHTYKDLPKKIYGHRLFLKTIMEKHGFKSIRTEWWHYSYRHAPNGLSDMLWNCE